MPAICCRMIVEQLFSRAYENRLALMQKQFSRWMTMCCWHWPRWEHASQGACLSLAGDCPNYLEPVQWRPRPNSEAAIYAGQESVEAVSEHWRSWSGKDTDVLRFIAGTTTRMERSACPDPSWVRTMAEKLRHGVPISTGSIEAGVASKCEGGRSGTFIVAATW